MHMLTSFSSKTVLCMLDKSGGSIASPRMSFGGPMFNCLDLRTSISSGHLVISGVNSSGNSYNENKVLSFTIKISFNIIVITFNYLILCRWGH